MNNQEYEAASIAAAGCYDRFEGEHKLQQWDEHIATLEAALAKAQEARREIVNQYNLNKGCSHVPKVIVPGTEGFPGGGLFCEKCGIDMHKKSPSFTEKEREAINLGRELSGYLK